MQAIREASYHHLLSMLRPAIPKSLSMMGALDNALKGRLDANFYVDKWPEFSALVCEYIWPRRSDVADIGAYATSSEALLSVLTEGNLVTWGKRQDFQRIEDRHADYLVHNLKPMRGHDITAGASLTCSAERSVVLFDDLSGLMHTPFGNIDPGSIDIEVIHKTLMDVLPEGLTIGTLQPHHAGMVASTWPRLHGWPNKEPYFREIIDRFYCPALYSVDNPDAPVSYVVQYPSNQHFGYTSDQYRGKRLADFLYMANGAHMTWIEKFFPFVAETSHQGRVNSDTQLFGGTLLDYKTKHLVIDPHAEC